MATYEIPAEPTTDRVWLLDHQLPGDAPIKFWRMSMDGGHQSYWSSPERHGERYSLEVLNALGTVSDVDPDDVSWLPPGPWTASMGIVYDANGDGVLYGNPKRREDGRMAALVARLVNEHVARRAGGAA